MTEKSEKCDRKLKLDDKKLTTVYGVSKTDAKFTCYCHHFSEDGRHCVQNGLGPDQAKQCNGVLYANASSAVGNFFGVSSLSLQCGKQRGTHKPCKDDNCPYVAAKQKCPYSVPE
eukprot:TRINITY_DN6635_c0_g1_i3.p1 TRINITY_DN6635_c0_g1~~TRINITY_DN6635_c0_g1_i3.p1  ORF type:complete len:115 (+),score=27.30 TRINITY_DN6635_c0_g1_i3:68-412(+)